LRRVNDRSLVRAIAYVIRADSPRKRAFEALRDIGFETKIKEIKTFADGSKKADWDLGMSLDAVSLARESRRHGRDLHRRRRLCSLLASPSRGCSG